MSSSRDTLHLLLLTETENCSLRMAASPTRSQPSARAVITS